eukprot:gb/GECG01013829.1/.p1 GENE.gb/GECG01013829.1/~~gb/GECG01013829.1/.p1  ORF type:complete len:1363 (+),score=184.92 gb/GECG01013829.1/:1-4089(+)
MSIVKEISGIQEPVAAWCPYGGLIEGDNGYALEELVAIGQSQGGDTGAGEDHGGRLEIYGLNLVTGSQNKGTPRVLRTVETPSKVTSIAWGRAGGRRYGLIAGGMVDGSIHVWDAQRLLQEHNQEAAYVTEIRRRQGSRDHLHTGSVTAMEFNGHESSPHLLASGSASGEIFITNLEKPQQPSVAAPTNQGSRTPEDPRQGALPAITDVSWNPCAAHILASSRQDGACIVWNLRKSAPFKILRDPHNKPVSCIAWSPNKGIGLMTGTDADQQSVVRVWELRPSAPPTYKELGGHAGGILSCGWNPHESAYIVTAARDAKTLLWDVESRDQKPIGEWHSGSDHDGQSDDDHHAMPYHSMDFHSAGDVFDGDGPAGQPGYRNSIMWSPKLRGVAATCALDGTVHIISDHTLNGVSATSCSKPPSWMKRRAGVAVGFGGRIAFFSNKIEKDVETIERIRLSKKKDFSAEADLPENVLGIFECLQQRGHMPLPRTLSLSGVSILTERTSEAVLMERMQRLHDIVFGITDFDECGRVPPEDHLQLICEYCAEQIAEAEERSDSVERDTWKFMEALMPGESMRTKVQRHLGYSPEEVRRLCIDYVGEDRAKRIGVIAPNPSETGADEFDNKAYQGISEVHNGEYSAEDVFDDDHEADTGVGNAESTATPVEDAYSMHNGSNVVESLRDQRSAAIAAARDMADTPGSNIRQTNNFNENTAGALLLRQAMLVGDFPSAVSICFKMNRYSDALMIAACGGEELWSAARQEYLMATKSGFSDLLDSVVGGELEKLIATAPLGTSEGQGSSGGWRDLLALLCAYSESNEFLSLTDALGDRLCSSATSEQHRFAASLCYMSAFNTSKIIPLWVEQCTQHLDTLFSHRNGADDRDVGVEMALAIHKCMEKVCIFRSFLARREQTGDVPVSEEQNHAAVSDSIVGQIFGQGKQSESETMLFSLYSLLLAQSGDVGRALNFARAIEPNRVHGDPFALTGSFRGTKFGLVDAVLRHTGRKHGSAPALAEDSSLDTSQVTLDRLWHGFDTHGRQILSGLYGFAYNHPAGACFPSQEIRIDQSAPISQTGPSRVSRGAKGDGHGAATLPRGQEHQYSQARHPPPHPHQQHAMPQQPQTQIHQQYAFQEQPSNGTVGVGYSQPQEPSVYGQGGAPVQQPQQVQTPAPQAQTRGRNDSGSYQPDGFVSSAGNATLGAKYGNYGGPANTGYSNTGSYGGGSIARQAYAESANQQTGRGQVGSGDLQHQEPPEEPTPEHVENLIATVSSLCDQLEQHFSLNAMERKRKKTKQAELDNNVRQMYRGGSEVIDNFVNEVGSALASGNINGALKSIEQVAQSREWSRHSRWITPLRTVLKLAESKIR